MGADLRRRFAVAGTVLGFLLLIGLDPVWAQVASRAWVLQSNATSVAGGQVAHATGYVIATIQVSVRSPAAQPPRFVVRFEQSMNATHYHSISCVPHHWGSMMVSEVSADALVRCNLMGAQWLRANITTYAGAGGIDVFAVLTADRWHIAALLGAEGPA